MVCGYSPHSVRLHCYGKQVTGCGESVHRPILYRREVTLTSNYTPGSLARLYRIPYVGACIDHIGR